MARAALVLALALGVAAAMTSAGGHGPQRRAPRANPLLVRLEVGGNLGGIIGGAGDVWVNDSGREGLLRIDGGGGHVLARLPLGRRVALAADGRGVWALRWGGRFFRRPNGPLYRIDPARNRITLRVPLDPQQVSFGVIAGARDVWVWGPRHVARIEPYAGSIQTEWDVDEDSGELTGAVAHEDGLLASAADGRLVRLGPEGMLPGPRVPELAGAELLAVDRGNALAAEAGALIAVDVRSGRPRWRRPLGFRISTVLPRDGILLTHGAAFRDAGDRLWAIDAASGRVLASTIVPSFGTTSMAVVNGALWFATAAGEVIVVPPLLVRLFISRAREGLTDSRR